jgi:NAD(P)H-dependent FMN reductase
MTAVDSTLPADLPADSRVAVIIGSTRPTRICPGIARWVAGAVQEDSPLLYELVDLAEVNLPFLDEPHKAASGQYEHEHTRAWSRLVSSYAGFILVFPQYNWGYPGVLKNALDFLYHEWAGKPVGCVTYGTRGGGKSAAQMHGVLQGLHMRELDEHLEVVIADEQKDANEQILDVNALMHPYLAQAKAMDIALVEAIKDSQ